MKLTDQIAQHIIDIHEGDNWTEVNIKNTLSDVSVKEAGMVTNISSNSIAALLHHITFYSEIVIERLKGNDPAIGQSNGFDVPNITIESNWMELKSKNLEAAHKLVTAIKHVPEERLFEPILPGKPSFYKTLHGIAEHAHYHLGQIVLIKKLVRIAPAPTSIH